MVLDPNKLNTNIKNLLVAKADDVDVAAQNWVDAYVDYAAEATGLTFSPTITAASKTTMKNSLKSYFQNVDNGTPLGAATAIANALTVFWLTPPIVFSILPAVAVSSVLGTGPLIIALNLCFIVVGGTEDSKASQISSAIDTFTKTVWVTNITPPGGMGSLI